MHTLSARALRDAFNRGEYSAEAIVTHFLTRIEQLDGQVGAFLSVCNQRALEKARALDLKRAAGKSVGRLAAIPIAIKDNIHVKGELSTCASPFLTNYYAPFDATVTQLIEAEDAIIIGKTNLDEFAMGSSTENSALKKTRNPWNLECTPGGSSGGSAAAVAARMAPLALGSDTGGSVRQPASYCGIVGYKPTYGRVSRFGLVAFGSSFDQVGPLTTCIEDAALLMEVIGRHCERDSTSIPQPPERYLSEFTGNLNNSRIGVPYSFLKGLGSETKQIFDRALEAAKAQGATIVDINLDLLKYSIAIYYILATAEASTNLARFDGIRYGRRAPQATTLDEVYDLSKEEGFGKEVKRRIFLGTYVLSAGYQDAYYKKAQKVRTLIIRQFQEAFHQCDCIATPVTLSTAFKIGAIQDPLQMYLEDIYTISANLAGVPAVSFPCGFAANGMPLGLQLMGPQRQDVALMTIAHALERVLPQASRLPELVK